jgi:hypothetical protein
MEQDRLAPVAVPDNTLLVSAGVVTLPEPALGFTQGLLVRDPDGHVMQLIAKEGPQLFSPCVVP